MNQYWFSGELVCFFQQSREAQIFRRRERAMAKFRSAKLLQKFASIHASICNHFNQERHLYSRGNFKLNRSKALTEWRRLAA
jgi:putative transposase